MRGKAGDPVEERPQPDRNVELRGLLFVTAIGVVAIVGAIVVTTYRQRAARAAETPTATARPL
jgi:hypothetical protein